MAAVAGGRMVSHARSSLAQIELCVLAPAYVAQFPTEMGLGNLELNSSPNYTLLSNRFLRTVFPLIYHFIAMQLFIF